MNFNPNKLPSSSKEIEWYWNRTVSGNISFSSVSIHNTQHDFTQPVDYFDLSSSTADQLSAIGERYSYVFALAHCGAMGTLNRNSKISTDLEKQLADWRKIRPYLD